MTIVLDIFRKLTDGTVYTEPVTFQRNEIRAYGRGKFTDQRSEILVKLKHFDNPVEMDVDMPYAQIREIFSDVFEKVKLT